MLGPTPVFVLWLSVEEKGIFGILVNAQWPADDVALVVETSGGEAPLMAACFPTEAIAAQRETTAKGPLFYHQAWSGISHHKRFQKLPCPVTW